MLPSGQLRYSHISLARYMELVPQKTKKELLEPIRNDFEITIFLNCKGTTNMIIAEFEILKNIRNYSRISTFDIHVDYFFYGLSDFQHNFRFSFLRSYQGSLIKNLSNSFRFPNCSQVFPFVGNGNMQRQVHR